MALPEENRRGRRSPGTDATQSSDGRIELQQSVVGEGKQPIKRTVAPIIQPSQASFGKISTVTYSPNPVVEGGTGAALVTLLAGSTGTKLRGQLRYIYGQNGTKQAGPFQQFNIPNGGTASVVFNVPIGIEPKGNLQVRTTFNKRVIDDIKVSILSADQLLPPSFTSSPVLSDTTGVSGESISVSFSSSGNPSPTATYQWFLNGSPIGGANASSYTTTATGGISAGVTLTNSEGTAYQIAEGQVGLPPSFLVQPSASATGVTVGTQVSIENVTASGTQPMSTSYVWTIDNSVIGGEASRTYTTGITGTTLTGKITVTNTYGSTQRTLNFGTVGVAPSFYVGDSGPIFANPSINNQVGDTVNVRGIYYNGVPVPGATATVTDSIGSRTVDASIVDTGTLNNEGKKTEQFEIRNTSDITVTINIGNVHGTSASSVVFNNISPANAAASFLGTPSASATGVTVGTQVSINNAGATGWPVPSTVYEWTQNSSVISGATLASYTPSATGPLSGKVTIDNTSGGATSATVSFGTITATGSSNFAPYFSGTPAGSTTNPDVGERMTFLTYGSTGLPAPTTTFQWYDDGVAISGATGYGYVLGATGEIVDAEVAYVVTNNGSSNYIIDGAAQPVLSMTRGVQYTFDLSGVSTSHPFRLATTENGSGGQYTTGWTTNGTQGQAGANAVFIVPADAPATLYYYCGNHNGMGNSINVRTVPATDVTMTGNLTGVVTLTNSEGTTGATIDYGTMLNANITNLSLSNVVAGGTLTATVTYGGTFDSITWTGVTS